MVTYNEVDAKALGIFYFAYGLYAAIEDYYQFDTSFMGIVNTLIAHSISFVVAVGYVVIYVRVELL